MLPVPVEMEKGIVEVLDHHVPFRAHLLRQHVVLLGEAFVKQLEVSRDLRAISRGR